MYRFLAASAAAWAFASSAASFAADYESAYPYEIQTVTNAARLRCGPGESFYVTERLTRGQSLEVYRQAPGGWLAVRPTEASYSLMAARYGRTTQQTDLVEVINDHAVSWIGTRDDEPSEFKWQVRLKMGERLVVLGRETRRAFPGGPRELHFRIEPPAGEFRWIHERDVRHASQVEASDSAPHQSIRLTDFRVVVEEVDGEPKRDGFVARRPTTASEQRSTPPADQRVELAADDGSPPAAGQVAIVPDSKPRAARESKTPRTKLPELSAKEFEELHRDLDVQLSLTVAKPVKEWQLAELHQDIDQLAQRGGSTIDRGRAQLLVEKIEQFEELQQRFQTSGLTETALASTAAAIPPADVATVPPLAPGTLDPRFDGAGWLYPIHSRKQAAPPYALLDANGAILQFVSPAPGLNLHRYLRQEIGIFGQRATSSKLDKPHVTVERVVSLKRHRR